MLFKKWITFKAFGLQITILSVDDGRVIQHEPIGETDGLPITLLYLGQLHYALAIDVSNESGNEIPDVEMEAFNSQFEDVGSSGCTSFFLCWY